MVLQLKLRGGVRLEGRMKQRSAERKAVILAALATDVDVLAALKFCDKALRKIPPEPFLAAAGKIDAHHARLMATFDEFAEQARRRAAPQGLDVLKSPSGRALLVPGTDIR